MVFTLECRKKILSCLNFQMFLYTSRWFQIMGIAKRGGHYLTGIHWNVSQMSKIFIKFLRSVPNKLIETKKVSKKLFISLWRTLNIGWLVRSPLLWTIYQLVRIPIWRFPGTQLVIWRQPCFCMTEYSPGHFPTGWNTKHLVFYAL